MRGVLLREKVVCVPGISSVCVYDSQFNTLRQTNCCSVATQPRRASDAGDTHGVGLVLPPCATWGDSISSDATGIWGVQVHSSTNMMMPNPKSRRWAALALAGSVPCCRAFFLPLAGRSSLGASAGRKVAASPVSPRCNGLARDAWTRGTSTR